MFIRPNVTSSGLWPNGRRNERRKEERGQLEFCSLAHGKRDA